MLGKQGEKSWFNKDEWINWMNEINFSVYNIKIIESSFFDNFLKNWDGFCLHKWI